MSVPFESAVGQLVRMGFSRDAAEREVNNQLRYLQAPPPDLIGRPRTEPPNIRIDAAWPLKLELPWSALESDDRKFGAIIRPVGPTRKLTPMLIMQAGYREAKTKARAIARVAVDGCDPVSTPLALVARVWLPDNRPGHDVANFAKCAHDALEKVVYTSDQWLHDVRWIRAGVDVDRPRAEITITPLTP